MLNRTVEKEWVNCVFKAANQVLFFPLNKLFGNLLSKLCKNVALLPPIIYLTSSVVSTVKQVDLHDKSSYFSPLSTSLIIMTMN